MIYFAKYKFKYRHKSKRVIFKKGINKQGINKQEQFVYYQLIKKGVDATVFI